MLAAMVFGGQIQQFLWDNMCKLLGHWPVIVTANMWEDHRGVVLDHFFTSGFGRTFAHRPLLKA